MPTVQVVDSGLSGVVDVSDVMSEIAYGRLKAEVRRQRQQSQELAEGFVNAVGRTADAHVAHPVDFISAFAFAPLRMADVDLRASRVLNSQWVQVILME